MPEMDGFDAAGDAVLCMAGGNPGHCDQRGRGHPSVERAYGDMGVPITSAARSSGSWCCAGEECASCFTQRSAFTRLVTDQVYEKKKHNGVLMINILSHVVEFRNSESGQHVLHIRTLTGLLPASAGAEDGPLPAG